MIVECEGYAFSVEVQYERHPLFCIHRKFIGHTVRQCKKLVTPNVQDKGNMEKRKSIVQGDIEGSITMIP